MYDKIEALRCAAITRDDGNLVPVPYYSESGTVYVDLCACTKIIAMANDQDIPQLPVTNHLYAISK